MIPRISLSLLMLILLTRHADAQTYLGDFTSYEALGKTIRVNAGTATVRFTFYRPEIVRVDFLPFPSSVLDSSLVVIRDTTETVAVSFTETDSTLQISSGAVSITCRKHPLRMSYRNTSLLLNEPLSGGLATNGTERWTTFSIAPDEHFYGTGERGTSLDKRGQAFDSYNTQAYGYGQPLSTMSINVPFIPSTKGYALYVENTYRGRFDVGASDPNRFVYKAYGGELTYYLIVAPTIPEQLEKYTWLTGRQPLPPRWAFGFLQSKFGYQTETEARALVQTMRLRQIPCDAIILDLYWFDRMGDVSWKLSSWPNPFQMMSDFRATGIKTIVITEPYIITPSINYPEAAANGYLATNATGQPYYIPNWWSCGCNATLLDITKPAAQSWWWNKHPHFFGNQLAGIWTDLGEPESHPAEMRHFLGSTAKVHNIYNLLWAKTLFEGFSQFRPGQRLFNLTRSGYAGIQRYGVLPWSGDVSKSFGGLGVQLPMLLNMGMSGLAYHHSDIGGFCCGNTTPELYIRWMQYGTFCPIARAHGTGQPTEPWGYGSQAETICRNYIELRYRLLPYIYTMAYKNFSAGLPLARPLFFDFPTENALTNESASYLWGDAMLVSPVVQAGQTSKSVYLPRDTWVDYWTDAVYRGGQSVTVSAPLERMPVFVKAGTIIPMQPVMNFSDERPFDTLMLAIYPMSGRAARFSLYEDDGETLAYQSGSYALTRFVQTTIETGTATAMTLTIGTTQGMYAGKPERRVYLSEIHGVNGQPSAVRKNSAPVLQRASYEELRNNGDGFYYDAAAHRLYIHTPTVPDSAYELIAENIEIVMSGSEQQQPLGFLLAQNYPNPFNPTTTITYVLGHPSSVVLKVFDLLGREVATLANELKQPGRYTVQWNASRQTSGVYYYRLQAGDYTATKKLLLLR